MDIKEALQAMANNTQRQVVELKGEPGPVGPRGPAGVDGKDGKDAQLKLGVVISGQEPAARVRFENGVHLLDLCLPTGPEGPRGRQGLQSEVPGPQGEKGDTPTEDEILRLIRKVVKENQEVLRGPKGERGEPGERGAQGVMGPAGQSIEGPRGESGHSVDEDMLKRILIGVLSDVGVLTEQAQKLIAVRAELRRALHQADSRHQAELANVYRRVDNIVG